MIGILYGVKNNIYPNFMKRESFLIKKLIILGIFINSAGKTILSKILKNIKKVYKDKEKYNKQQSKYQLK